MLNKLKDCKGKDIGVRFLQVVAMNHPGVTLIETLVALAILGITVIVILNSAAAALKGAMLTQERVTVESLAKCQLEYIKAQPYSATGENYMMSVPAKLQEQGYSIAPISVVESVTGLQKVTVTVKRNDQTLLRVQDYKVNR